MRNRSVHGGRHELGQNFLTHQPTITKIVGLVAATSGSILEIGAGAGALTIPLAKLGRPLQAIDIDEHLVAALRRKLPKVDIEQRDALQAPLDRSVLVGNLPFHVTTPLLRRILNASSWSQAIVLTQWEVARKRAGVGGMTMMTAQTAPWFTFGLHGRVPASGFTPRPGVDGGILALTRRTMPLVDSHDRRQYEKFVHDIFTGRGRVVGSILRARYGRSVSLDRTMRQASISQNALPRDISPQQWAALWHAIGFTHPPRKPKRRGANHV